MSERLIIIAASWLALGGLALAGADAAAVENPAKTTEAPESTEAPKGDEAVEGAPESPEGVSTNEYPTFGEVELEMIEVTIDRLERSLPPFFTNDSVVISQSNGISFKGKIQQITDVGLEMEVTEDLVKQVRIENLSVTDRLRCDMVFRDLWVTELARTRARSHLIELGASFTPYDLSQTDQMYLALLKGDPGAQVAMGHRHLRRAKRSGDYSSTFLYYYLASLQDSNEGRYNLGVMYTRGLAVPVDRVKGLQLIATAAADGHDTSAKFLDNARVSAEAAKAATEAQRVADAAEQEAYHKAAKRRAASSGRGKVWIKRW